MCEEAVFYVVLFMIRGPPTNFQSEKFTESWLCMRNFKNDGSEQFILQNQFTAYLQIAIRRAKARYLNKTRLITDTELSNNVLQMSSIPQTAGDAIFLPLSKSVKSQTRDEQLDLGILMAEMLLQLSEREVTILKGKIFDELTFQELAARLGVDMNTVKSTYYRSLKKLRDLLDS